MTYYNNTAWQQVYVKLHELLNTRGSLLKNTRTDIKNCTLKMTLYVLRIIN